MKKIIKFFTSSLNGNIAYHVGDDKNSVDQNRLNLALTYDFDIKQLRYMNQVHGNRIEVVDSNSPVLIDDCDALITNESNLPIMVMVADCIPILMYDKTKGVIAAVHAGRNSTFQNIAQLCAQKMINEFDCKAEDICVEMGPSIQKCCYEVSYELVEIVKKSFGIEFVSDKFINLQGINKKQLKSIGVTDIKISNICTKCSNKPYFSYRKNRHTGRFSAVIMLKDE